MLCMYKCIRVNLINFNLSNGYFNGFFILFFIRRFI